MKTLKINRAALVLAAWNASSVRNRCPAVRPQPVEDNTTTVERQLDEIQHTFSVRWEW
jgi:hypothetical protein